MDPSTVFCTRCAAPLPPEALDPAGQPRSVLCLRCRTPLLVVTFPALRAGVPVGQAGEPVLGDSQAGCFFHPTKRAAVLCDNCGRFLCSLCDVPTGRYHFCPTCVVTGRGSAALDHHRPAYDTMALAMALLPLAVTPLVALFLAIRFWSAPGSLAPRSRLRWVAAIILSLIQIAGWCILFFG